MLQSFIHNYLLIQDGYDIKLRNKSEIDNRRKNKTSFKKNYLKVLVSFSNIWPVVKTISVSCQTHSDTLDQYINQDTLRFMGHNEYFWRPALNQWFPALSCDPFKILFNGVVRRLKGWQKWKKNRSSSQFYMIFSFFLSSELFFGKTPDDYTSLNIKNLCRHLQLKICWHCSIYFEGFYIQLSDSGHLRTDKKWKSNPEPNW